MGGRCGDADAGWDASHKWAETEIWYKDPSKSGVSCGTKPCTGLGGGTIFTDATHTAGSDIEKCVSKLMKCGEWTNVASDIAAHAPGQYVYLKDQKDKSCKSKQCNVKDDTHCLQQTCYHV